MIVAELKAMNAPRLIIEGGEEIEKAVAAGLNPPHQVVVYIRHWVTRQRDNNRYGR
jgi:hypothetical protein